MSVEALVVSDHKGTVFTDVCILGRCFNEMEKCTLSFEHFWIEKTFFSRLAWTQAEADTAER